MVLPVISKCGTLDECVLVLMRGESLVVIRQVGQHLVCGSQGVRRFVLEDVLGDVRDWKREKKCKQGHRRVTKNLTCILMMS